MLSFTVFDVVEQIQQNLGLDVDRNYKKNKIGDFDFRYLKDKYNEKFYWI